MSGYLESGSANRSPGVLASGSARRMQSLESIVLCRASGNRGTGSRACGAYLQAKGFVCNKVVAKTEERTHDSLKVQAMFEDRPLKCPIFGY